MAEVKSTAVVGIYSRKSKYSEGSESVATQIALCRELAEKQHPGCSVIVYDEDEGFSGKNTNRPGFQRLMDDVKNHRISVLYVYRLDRMGRSVRDVCSTLEDLQRHSVSFVSLRESFDTSTPMGRAMLYIASVFAQLERETLAERVKDAIHTMAMQGRWLGGNTPTGFTSNRDNRGWCYLEPVQPELEKVKHLYEKFTELGSLSALVTYCLQNGIKSRNGTDYSRTTLRTLLTNPVYCTADEDALEFFTNNDHSLAAIPSEFDSKHGMMPFGRTTRNEKTVVINPTSRWIVAVGAHVGTVSGALWVKAQQIFEQNKELGSAWRGRRTENALLSGVIRCGCCGSPMRPKAYGKPMPDGTRRFAYYCNKKVESRSVLCKMKSAPGNDVDAMVLQKLKELSDQFDSITSSATDLLAVSAAKVAEENIQNLQKEIQKAQKQLDNLTDTLAEGIPQAARKQIYQRMEDLNDLILEKEAAISSITKQQINSQANTSFLLNAAEIFSSFGEGFSSLTHDEKRRLIRNVVSSVVWDGESITMNMQGENDSLG